MRRRQYEGRRLPMVAVWAWLGAWTVALALGVFSFRMAMAWSSRPDIELFFLPAARAVREGLSPYTSEGFIYSPLLPALLAPFASATWIVAGWTALLVGVAILSCWVAARAVSRGLSSAVRAGQFAFASATLMSSYTLAVELEYGQVHLLILLAITTAMLATSSGRRGVAGTSLALAAAIKTWPVFLLLWLVRRPVLRRLPEWTGVLAVSAILAVLAVAVGGPKVFADMARVTGQGSDQAVVAYSAWGAGKVLFTQSTLSIPVFVSPTLRVVTTAVLVVWVLGLLVIVLRFPGNPVLALPNVVFCVVLLLPVSHYYYLPILMPALWWWVAYAIRSRRQWGPWIVSLFLFIWWYLALFPIPPSGPDLETQTGSFVTILGSTLLAATFSIVGGARLRPTAGSSNPMDEGVLMPPATVAKIPRYSEGINPFEPTRGHRYWDRAM